MDTKTTLDLLFETFRSKTVMIIGDVMVDSYLWGQVERISPEAPVPVVVLRKRENRLGGAANVALNIKALGAKPILFSVIGDDPQAGLFLALMQKEGISTEGIIRSRNRLTTTKSRVIGNKVQLLRIDEEMNEDLCSADEQDLTGRVEEMIKRKAVDMIIFQDYNKGTLTSVLIQRIIHCARQAGVPVAVDPKKKNFETYRGVTLFKPNFKELKEGLKKDLDLGNKDEIVTTMNRMRETLDIDIVLTTLSEEGLILSGQINNSQPENHFIPAFRRSIADVSGAGDTVIAVAALCLASGATLQETALISNLSGGLVCEEVGVVPVDVNKLLAEVKAIYDHEPGS